MPVLHGPAVHLSYDVVQVVCIFIKQSPVPRAEACVTHLPYFDTSNIPPDSIWLGALSMEIGKRLSFLLIGASFGAFIGIVFWWLYGLAHSLNYDGPGVAPVIRHWLTHAATAFALIGFVFRERVGDVVGDTLKVILQFEIDQPPGNFSGWLVAIVFSAIIIAAIWFAVPS